MAAREIPSGQWKPFFDDLSREHLGQRVWVRATAQREGGARDEAKDLPLIGITTDQPGVGPERIEVIVGDSPDAHLTHAVLRPSKVCVEEDDRGVDFVQIESARAAPPRCRFLCRPAPIPRRRLLETSCKRR